MRSLSTKGRYFLAALLLLPPAVFATDISIQGVCITGQGLAGNCSTTPGFDGTTDAVGITPAASSTVGSGSSNITVPDGVNNDPFTVSWTYSASYGGGLTLVFDPTVTYTGTSPTAAGDTITVDFFQNFYDNTPGTWNGTYGETVDLSMSAGVGSSSTASGMLCFTSTGTDCLALETLDGPGPNSVTDPNSADLTSLGNGDYLLAEYEFTYYFAPGTTDGTNIGTPGVPEPALGLPVGLVLLGLACYRVVVRRRRSDYSAS